MKNQLIAFLKRFKEIDKSILKVMNYGFLCSILFGVLGIAILLLYKFTYISHDLIEASMILFRSGLLFTAQIFACGYALDTLKKLNTF